MCDRSAEDVQSFMALDPNCYLCKGPACSAPVLYFFLWLMILNASYFFFFETEEMLNYLNSKEKHFLNLTKINKN